MAVRNLAKAIQITTCAVTADQWQLFDKPKRNQAARELNAAFKKAVNSGKSRGGVNEAVWAPMKKWADLGAMDSEAFHMLSDMLDEIFGRG